jgi:DNA modification methylase
METNKIINGDCLKLIKDIPDNSIDMILTDPPYFDNLKANWNAKEQYVNRVREREPRKLSCLEKSIRGKFKESRENKLTNHTVRLIWGRYKSYEKGKYD